MRLDLRFGSWFNLSLTIGNVDDEDEAPESYTHLGGSFETAPDIEAVEPTWQQYDEKVQRFGFQR